VEAIALLAGHNRTAMTELAEVPYRAGKNHAVRGG
jgi:hypothetical protein